MGYDSMKSYGENCLYEISSEFGSKKRHGKEDPNTLRKRIMELQEDNEMLHCEVMRLRAELAKKQPTGSRVAKHV